ncbi:hypothetical protein [Kitasatospora purpeofusca]|uniref:hypothetical protein n=1 Tax=Kitasatospora purpeofusca TaxID=67352 RepID=UPI003649493F
MQALRYVLAPFGGAKRLCTDYVIGAVLLLKRSTEKTQLLPPEIVRWGGSSWSFWWLRDEPHLNRENDGPPS